MTQAEHHDEQQPQMTRIQYRGVPKDGVGYAKSSNGTLQVSQETHEAFQKYLKDPKRPVSTPPLETEVRAFIAGRASLDGKPANGFDVNNGYSSFADGRQAGHDDIEREIREELTRRNVIIPDVISITALVQEGMKALAETVMNEAITALANDESRKDRTKQSFGRGLHEAKSLIITTGKHRAGWTDEHVSTIVGDLDNREAITALSLALANTPREGMDPLTAKIAAVVAEHVTTDRERTLGELASVEERMIALDRELETTRAELDATKPDAEQFRLMRSMFQK